MTTISIEGLAVPTVHLNGTHGQDLVEQQKKVWHAAKALQDALCEAAPHGRDYYVQPGPALQIARGQNDDRIAAVQKILGETEAILDSLWHQVDR